MALDAERLTGFIGSEIAPYAAEWDAKGEIDPALIKELAAEGILGAAISTEFGGSGLDNLSFGLLCEELGAACSSTRSLLTVQSMVAFTIRRWGTESQRSEWLPKMASGDSVAAFCLTEPEVGSDAAAVQAEIRTEGSNCIVNGRKVWVTFARSAAMFLVIGRSEAGPTAVLVPRDTPGLSIEPVTGQLGLRAAGIANVVLSNCIVPIAHVLGKPGAGFTHVATTTLDHGRFSVAWGCVGIARSCLDRSVRFAKQRRQFGSPLIQTQLIRAMVTDMYTGYSASRLLCEDAANARDSGDPSYIAKTMVAKYYSSGVAFRAASDAVQIHGARGTDPRYGVERHYRDAKIMQLIEGTDQMLQLTIADIAARETR